MAHRFWEGDYSRSSDVDTNEPVRGFKRAYVVVELSPRSEQVLSAGFTGHTLQGLYHTSALAQCHIPHIQAPPAPDCMCGFYALDAREPILKQKFASGDLTLAIASSALLEVDLYGTVLEGSRGFRASNQRVRAVEVDRLCRFCDKDASCMVPTLQLHVLETRAHILTSSCDSCADLREVSQDLRFSLAQIASLLSVSVNFADIREQNTASVTLQLPQTTAQRFRPFLAPFIYTLALLVWLVAGGLGYSGVATAAMVFATVSSPFLFKISGLWDNADPWLKKASVGIAIAGAAVGLIAVLTPPPHPQMPAAQSLHILSESYSEELLLASIGALLQDDPSYESTKPFPVLQDLIADSGDSFEIVVGSAQEPGEVSAGFDFLVEDISATGFVLATVREDGSCVAASGVLNGVGVEFFPAPDDSACDAPALVRVLRDASL